ncbi:hypothetical protein ACFLYM_02640, partial [Chloroflexota bacterium]
SSPEAGVHSYREGNVVYISAVLDDGWQFDGWTGDITEPDMTNILVTMDTDKTITANFSEVKPDWWLISGIIAGVLVTGVIMWSLVKKRAALHNIFLRCRSILK